MFAVACFCHIHERQVCDEAVNFEEARHPSYFELQRLERIGPNLRTGGHLYGRPTRVGSRVVAPAAVDQKLQCIRDSVARLWRYSEV